MPENFVVCKRLEAKRSFSASKKTNLLLFSARPAAITTGRAIEKIREILVGTIGLEPTTPTMSR